MRSYLFVPQLVADARLHTPVLYCTSVLYCLISLFKLLPPPTPPPCPSRLPPNIHWPNINEFHEKNRKKLAKTSHYISSYLSG